MVAGCSFQSEPNFHAHPEFVYRNAVFDLRGKIMAGRDGQGESFSPGSRKRDRTIDDALKTMERLATWLETASDENAWSQSEDPIQTAMLHGMLMHLRNQIDQFITLGGDELQETIRAVRSLAAQSEDV